MLCGTRAIGCSVRPSHEVRVVMCVYYLDITVSYGDIGVLVTEFGNHEGKDGSDKLSELGMLLTNQFGINDSLRQNLANYFVSKNLKMVVIKE